MRKREWGVFVYDPENMYLGRDAVRRYKVRAAAERLADKMTFEGPGDVPAGGYVAREITRE